MTGYVYIIGAGCGSADLITVRGLKALKRCDTVVYDALIDSSLLCDAAEGAELICVGKRSGKHSAVQEEINALLAEKALAGRTVARLKGGDPFVFGRGGEEIIYLRERGIPFSVIPGISSCIAVPELAGIPVTHRSVSRAFHVITAHTADENPDFSQYAALDGTLVFLMGLAALGKIADGLMQGGMSAETPAAVISGGGTPFQHTVRGTLADIEEAAQSGNCTPPAVIVVGETAAYEFCCSAPRGVLSGVTVTVTGTEKFTQKLRTLLEDDGADVCVHTHIGVVQTCDIPPLDGYGCIAFTSAYGAEMFISDCKRKRIDLRTLAGVKIAAVGGGTASVLEAAGICPDIVPESFTVSGLANAVADDIPAGCRVLVLRARLGSGELGRVFDSRGIAYDDVKIYDTVCRAGISGIAVRTDYIVFGSSSGVRAFFESGGTAAANTKAVCIGTQTAETAKEYAQNIILTASPHSAEGVVNAIKGDMVK